jgi:uncharacterized membrane-anchored protein
MSWRSLAFAIVSTLELATLGLRTLGLGTLGLGPLGLGPLGLAVVPALAEQSSAEEKLWAEIGKLSWQAGPSEGKVAGKATLPIPKGHLFLPAAGTDKFLALMKNLPRPNSYTLAPENLQWFSIFDFEQTGYVRDDETLDPDAILEGLKAENVRGNEERKSRGLPPVYLEGWFITPHYDLQSKQLEWATKVRSTSGDIIVNYKIRLLSRSGVMNAILVCEPATLEADIRAFKTILIGFSFDAGERYAEFRAGDKIAEYGLTGLIVGGAAAAAKPFGKVAIVIIASLGALALGFFGWISRAR